MFPADTKTILGRSDVPFSHWAYEVIKKLAGNNPKLEL